MYLFNNFPVWVFVQLSYQGVYRHGDSNGF